MNNLKELPKDWKWVELQDISEITSSRRIFQSDYVQEGVPFYRTKEIKELSEGKNIKIELFISTEKYDAIREKNPVPKIGDILLSAVGTIGVSYIIKNEDCFYFKDGNLIWVRNLKNVDAKYLDYNFAHFIKFQQSILTSGSAYNALTIVKLKKYLVPLPPLSTQQAIVSKIEELFSELDKGVENLKTAQQQLKVYRQAVLKWAFEGKLTNIESSVKLVRFGDIIKIVSGNTPKGLEKFKGSVGKIQFYKVSDMNLQGNEIEMRNTNLSLNKEDTEKLKIKLYPKGTVIFPKRGGAILTNKKRMLSKDSSFDLNIMGVLPNEKVDSKYLFYWFQKLDLSKIYDGSNIPQINNKNIEPLEFHYCSIEEQTQIVQEIEKRLSVADKMEESIQQSLLQAESLRQSILKKAFEGGLVK
jgi:type I restriction enzyme S subunit